jgi:putative redox protein
VAEKTVLRTRVTWIEGLQYVAVGERSGGTFVMDGAPEHGGSSHSVRPVEALLASLAGCTGMDVISILQKKRQRVSRLCVNTTGFQAADFPKRFERIEIEFVVRGWDIDEQAVARSIELSKDKYCSVSASLNAELIYTYRIESEPIV